MRVNKPNVLGLHPVYSSPQPGWTEPSARLNNDVDRIGGRVVDDSCAAFFELSFHATALLLEIDIAVAIVGALSQDERFDDPGQRRVRELLVGHLNQDGVEPLAQT